MSILALTETLRPPEPHPLQMDVLNGTLLYFSGNTNRPKGHPFMMATLRGGEGQLHVDVHKTN